MPFYYRIHETDEQGRSYYSSIVTLPLNPAKHKLSVYPNPASCSITLYGYQEKKEGMILRMYNAEGRLVRSESWQVSAGNYSRGLPIEELANGLYTLHLSGTQGGERQEIRFIKKP